MSQAGPLTCQLDFFGANEAITNYRPDRDAWTATMIYAGNELKAVQQKRELTIENIRRKYDVAMIQDAAPAV